MILRCGRWVVTIAVFSAVSCGGKTESSTKPNGTAGSEVGRTSEVATSEVTGKLAAAIAPPSALVVLEPKSGAEVPIKGEPAIMDQAGYAFLPGFLLAQIGQAVQFRNSEDVLHNVRVTETSQQKPIFNIATVPFGSYEHKFEESGVYNVTCDIHPTMRATILVTATPYTATSDAEGRFIIANVKPGAYNLTVYAGDAPVVRAIEVKGSRTDLGVIQ